MRRTSMVFLLLAVIVSCSKVSAHEIYGKYRIVKAYALIHNKGPLFEIESNYIGKEIFFDGKSIAFENTRYYIDEKKTENLTKIAFEGYYSGLDYSFIDIEIFGRGDISSITNYYILAHKDDDLIGSQLFCANRKMLIEAQSEFENIREWPFDDFFYLAEKVE